MNVPWLNKAQPHAEIWGAENGARYAQDGHEFDGAGRWLPRMAVRRFPSRRGDGVRCGPGRRES